MVAAGIDIGSRTIKIVLFEDDHITYSKISENTYNPLKTCELLLKNLSYDAITATGYGRHLFADHYTSDVISEIKAFAIGVHHELPSTRTILDIGGQDTKAIAIDANGSIKKFEMNDKCAAGTGRFLEIMAMALRFSLDEFGEKALITINAENINSMCAVFAESEIISMLANGADRNEVARGIHYSVIKKSMAIIKRVGMKKDITFAGGGAKSIALKTLMEELYKQPVLVPKDPQIMGALGCAIHSYRRLVGQ